MMTSLPRNLSFFLLEAGWEKVSEKKITWQQIHLLLVSPDSIHSFSEDVFLCFDVKF